jgi:cellulose synthase/poly-beta-1,6-N-acetylglucosamine synthase-like glycosyltransferase
VSPELVGWLTDIGTVTLLVLVLLGMIPVLSTFYQLLLVALHAWRNHYPRTAPYLPRVAVLIPAWNEGLVLDASIERLLALEYPADRLRVYVVDDASTDSTPDVVRAKAAQHPGRVVLLRREKGGEGKAHTLNHGLREILRDDWMQALLVMDADVIYLPDSLRRMTRHLADPQVGAVTAYIAEGSRDTTYLTRFIGFEYVLAQLASRRAANVLNAMACLAGGAQLHSRTNLEELGGQIDTTTLAEDTITTFETQLNGRRTVFEPHAVVLAEEPQSVDALWRQRLRWARGNVQVSRRYHAVWFRPDRNRHLGSFSFGLQWFSILFLPLIMSVVPIGFIGLYLMDDPIAHDVFRGLWISAACVYVFSVLLGMQLDGRVARISWREAIAFPGVVSVLIMITAFFPGLLEVWLPAKLGWDVDPWERRTLMIGVYLWVAVVMAGAWLARRVERTRVGKVLTPTLMYLVGYGPLLCAVTFDAYIKELRGATATWEKTEKTGRVVG